MEKEIDKNQTMRIAISVIIILAILYGVYYFIFSLPEEETYKDCVNTCVSDAGSCSADFDYCISLYYILDKSDNSYIPKEDYESCFYDLESCVSDDLETCVSNCEE